MRKGRNARPGSDATQWVGLVSKPLPASTCRPPPASLRGPLGSPVSISHAPGLGGAEGSGLGLPLSCAAFLPTEVTRRQQRGEESTVTGQQCPHRHALWDPPF